MALISVSPIDEYDAKAKLVLYKAFNFKNEDDEHYTYMLWVSEKYLEHENLVNEIPHYGLHHSTGVLIYYHSQKELFYVWTRTKDIEQNRTQETYKLGKMPELPVGVETDTDSKG